MNNGKLTALWELDKIQLLALLGASDMWREERVHESLEVGSPPLGKGVGDVPFTCVAIVGELGSRWSKTFIQTILEA